ncbi:unnamed protein product, partial [Adineta steineri]
YDNVFKNTPAMNMKLIVGNRNRRDALNELIRKRPKRSLLQNILIKNKYSKLLDFVPLKRYKVFSIDETTSSDTVQELITIAKKTYMVTLFPYDHN